MMDLNLVYLVLILGLGLVVLFVILFIFDKKYPKVKFILFEGNNVFIRTRRIIGNMVVDKNLIDVVLQADKLVGEDIRDYDYVYLKGQKHYLAAIGNGALIPLRYGDVNLPNSIISKLKKSNLSKEELQFIFNKLKNPKLELAEVKTARDVAVRYIEMNDQVREQLKHANIILSSILPSLVVILPALVLIVAFAIVFNNVGTVLDRVSEHIDRSTERLVTLDEALSRLSETENQTQTIITTNETLSNPNLPNLGG